MYRITLFLSLLFIGRLLIANDEFYFSSLKHKEGLSQLSVLDICQDNKGYLWFATRNGLNRYDGKNFTIYRHLRADSTTLTDNHITALKPVGEGLWIGTVNGLNYFDIRRNKITGYLQQKYPQLAGGDIISLETDSKQRLWIGTRTGLSVFEEKKGFRLIEIPNCPDQQPITALCLLNDNRLLIGTQRKGIYIFDLEKERFAGHIEGSENDVVSALYQDSKGSVWLGTASAGVVRYNSEDWGATRFTTSNSSLSDNQIRCFAEYNKKLVIGSFNGLNIYDPERKEMVAHLDSRNQKGRLSHYSVYSLFADQQGGLWAGTYSGGVNYHHPLNNRFEFYEPFATQNEWTGVFGPMYYHPNGLLYIATEGGGLMAFDPKNGNHESYFPEEKITKSYSEYIIKSIFGEGDSIWCGTNNGKIYKFDVRHKIFSLFYEFADYRKTGIYSILKDKSGYLWGGTIREIGLHRFDQSGSPISSFALADGSLVSFGDIRCMLEADNGTYLIGTRAKGLFLYDMNRGLLSNYHIHSAVDSCRLPDNYVTCLLQKSSDEYWIGTNDGGIVVYRKGKGIIRIYDRTKGLADDQICSMIKDRDSSVWVSTQSAITHIDLKRNSLRNYTTANGIEAREFTPNGGVSLPDRTIFFSSSNGFTQFHPDGLQINRSVPPMVLTGLYVNNKLVLPGERDGILTESLDDTRVIRLNYSQRNFSISYAALNYVYHHQNQYAYRLKGHHKEWNYVGERTQAYFTNIDIGVYEFEVMGSNNDGLWNQAPRRLKLIIEAPWWLTKWAYFGYFLVCGFVISTAVYYSRIRRRLQYDLKKQQFEKEKEKEFHEAKLRIFTSFSHELRIPLMLILAPLEDLIKKLSPQFSGMETLKMIFHNGQKLMYLVNQLMDLQKQQSGFFKIKVQQQSVNNFLKEIAIAFNQYAESRQIQFESKLPQEDESVFFDASLMEKAMFNLLSNAFKFTPEGGAVCMEASLVSENYLSDYSSSALIRELRAKSVNKSGFSAKYLLVRISDTGVGISEPDKKHIFSAFYQGRNGKSGEVEGTGIGLSLTRSVVDLHHGAIIVADNEPKGTIFTLCIPVSADAFSEEEKNNSVSEISDKQEIPRMPSALGSSVVGNSEEEMDMAIEKSDARILLVEDNYELHCYVKSVLEKRFNVMSAYNGDEASAIIFKEIPDLIVSDIMMPGIDGLELCRMIKEDTRTADIPIILMTARSMVMQIKEGFLAGADEYITKPFRADVLIVRIENLLHIRKNLRKLYGRQFSVEKMEVENSRQSKDDFMIQFFDLVDRHLSEPDLNVEFISRELGLSRANFYRKLKGFTSQSPMELIRNKRIEIAAKLLLETDMSVAEIAQTVGFSNAHFSSVFKNHYGMTPKEYSNSLINS